MKTSICNLARRHGNARFSPYLASLLERTLKAFFFIYSFSYCKKKGFGKPPSYQICILFFFHMRIYRYTHENKKNRYARDLRGIKGFV